MKQAKLATYPEASPDVPVWHTLKTIKSELTPDRWIKTWFGGDGGQGWTMCLANMARYVETGDKNEPRPFSSTPAGKAESLLHRLVLQKGYSDIPTFNDTGSYERVVALLDEAIDLVKPDTPVTFATDAMTEEEREEIEEASKEATAQIFREKFAALNPKRALQRLLRNRSLDSVEEVDVREQAYALGQGREMDKLLCNMRSGSGAPGHHGLSRLREGREEGEAASLGTEQ